MQKPTEPAKPEAPTKEKLKVLSIIFPGFNTLDLNGPLDVFTKSGLTEHFEVDIASDHDANALGPATQSEDNAWKAEDDKNKKEDKPLVQHKTLLPGDITISTEGLRVQTTVNINEDLVKNASRDYDVLHIAGGGKWGVDTQVAKADSRFMRLIKKFAETAPPEGKRRILLSICTGAMFPATVDVFNNCFCTTHWAIYKKVAKVLHERKLLCKGEQSHGDFKAEDPDVKHLYSVPQVIKARFVDAGRNDKGVQIISSGGISCGIDAALHVVKSLVSVEESVEIAQVLDYLWHQTEGVIFGDLYAPNTICQSPEKEKKMVSKKRETRDDGTGMDMLLGTHVI